MTSHAPRTTRTPQRNLTPFAMLLPLVVLFLGVCVYPLCRAAYWAVHASTGDRDTPALFVGLGNLARVAADRVFWFALLNTVGFTLVYVVMLVPLALGLAMLLNRATLPGRAIFRLLFFSPSLVGPVYLATLAAATLAREGALGPALARLGLLPPGTDLLAEPMAVMPILVVVSLWAGVGYAMVYLLAALQSVDPELLDAARADGAGPWRLLWHVTLPALRPTLAFILLLSGVGGLQLFELPFVLYQSQNNGAGPGGAALTLSMVLFSAQFEQGDPGYAAVVGWVLAVVVTGLSLALVRAATRPSSASASQVATQGAAT